MIDSRHREYFRVISVYHRLPASQRPKALAGFVLTHAKHHNDPLTRGLLDRFYQMEKQKYAAAKKPA